MCICVNIYFYLGALGDVDVGAVRKDSRVI